MQLGQGVSAVSPLPGGVLHQRRWPEVRPEEGVRLDLEYSQRIFLARQWSHACQARLRFLDVSLSVLIPLPTSKVAGSMSTEVYM